MAGPVSPSPEGQAQKPPSPSLRQSPPDLPAPSPQDHAGAIPLAPAEVPVPPAVAPQAAPPAQTAEPAQTVQPVEMAQPVLRALVDVYFDYDRFMLREDAKKTIEDNAVMLKADNGWKLVVEGHCDERGTADYNLVLGEKRAEAVKRYLINLGLPASRLQIVSYGKERPFCAEHTEECRQSNRRVHFVIK